MNLKRFSLASVVIWVVSGLLGWLTCGWLFNWVYTLEPVSAWKAPEIMMSASNMTWMTLFGLLTAVLFVLGFYWFYNGLPGKTPVCKGVKYGLILWLVSVLPGVLGMIFYSTINVVVIWYWVAIALVMNAINGALVGWIYKK